MKRFYDIYRPRRSPDDIRPMSHYFRSQDIPFSPFTKIGHLADASETPDTASAAPASKPVPTTAPTAPEPDYSVVVEHKKAVFPAGFKLPASTAVDPPVPQTVPRKIPVLTPLEISEPAITTPTTYTTAPKATGLISELQHAAGKHLHKRRHVYSVRENSAPMLALTSQRMKGIGLLLTSVLLVAVLGYSGASDEQSASRTPSRVSPKPAITANTSASAESNVAPVDTSILTSTPPEAAGDTNASQEAPAAPAPSSTRRTTHRANFGFGSAPESSAQDQSPAPAEASSPAPTDNSSSTPAVIPETPITSPADGQPETPVVTDPPVTPTGSNVTQPELPPTPSAVPIPTPTLPISTEPGTP